MFLAILLATSAAITPAQSAAADKVAVAYLTQACSDGLERWGIVTVSDAVFHLATINPETRTIGLIDDDVLKSVCSRGPLVVSHCHTTNDILSLFPTADLSGDSGSDMGIVAYVEYRCALWNKEAGLPPPVVEHRLVHTGGSGAVVRYGLGGERLEQARTLADTMAQASRAPDIRVGHHGVPQIGNIGQSFKQVLAVHDSLAELYAVINREYGDRFIQVLRESCPGVSTRQDLADCTTFTVQSFARTLDPCGGYWVLPPGATAVPACVPPTGPRISLGGPRYPGWTELTPETYDAFTATGRVVLALCDDVGSGRAKPCRTYLAEMNAKLPSCGNLKRGYVDVSRYADLRERHLDRWLDAGLLENGRRYTINVPNVSGQLFSLIVCGPEVLFGSMKH